MSKGKLSRQPLGIVVRLKNILAIFSEHEHKAGGEY